MSEQRWPVSHDQTVHITCAISRLSDSIVVLQESRSDAHRTLDNVMTEANKFAEAHGIQASLPASRTRRVPRQPDENAVDDPIIDQNERFRIGVLNVCLDTCSDCPTN